MSNATDTYIKVLGYESARDELLSFLKILDHGGLVLDASLSLWERGESFANRCVDDLAGGRAGVE